MNRYLQAGTHLKKPKCPGEYEIKDIVGTGASCVVYYAEFVDPTGVRTEHLLKEYNPRGIKLDRNDTGSLRTCSEDDNLAYKAGLHRFMASCNMQLNVRRCTDAKNSTSNIQSAFETNGTCYIDMTVMAGTTYEKVEKETLFNLLKRIEAITKVVGSYHENGLLHLDIKPDNIFVLPETVELVQMFDFDSVIKKSDVASASFLSYTQSWAAQEQILPNRRNRICEATDIFAIGEILFYKIMGRHSEAHERRSFATFTFDYSKKLFEGVNPRVFPLLSGIFKHTICNVVTNRYQSTSELLEELKQAILLADPHEAFLQHHLPSKAAYFVGRDAELQEIEKRLSQNDKLFISGMGGIGKSELVRQYAHVHKEEYDAVIFSVCNTDLESMILDDSLLPICHVQRGDKKDRDYLEEKYSALKHLCNKRVLIIVDNFNDLQDNALSMLLQLNCKMLFTTRCDVSEYNYEQLSLGVLEKEHVWDIFCTWYKKSLNSKDRTAVEQILDLYQDHTMAVELIAKQMRASCVSPKEMLTKLNAGGFSESGRERVIHAKDGLNTKMNIHAHIRHLFDISELSKEQVYVLANLSLIPPTGIAKNQFHDWCKLDSYEDINNLTESGWIRQDEESKLISLHAVIADVMLDELEQDFSVCEEMIESANKYIRGDWFCADAVSRNRFVEVADSLCSRLASYDDFPFYGVEFVNLCASRIFRFGSISKWIQYVRKAMQVYRLHVQHIDTQTLVMFNTLALLYHENGQLKTARKYYHRVLKEASFLWKNRDPLSQTVYNNLATLYMDMGEPGRAAKCLEKVVNQKELLPYETVLSKATSYDNLGMVYEEMTNYSDAIAAYLRAQKLLVSAGYEKSEDMAISCGHLGSLYFDLDDYDNAEIYQKKALKIWQESFGENYIDTAHAYYDLGLLYREKGKYQEAVENLKKSINAYNHSGVDVQKYVAKAYSTLGKTYVELKDFSSAEEYYRKSLSIRIHLYGENHELVHLVQDRINKLQETKME